MVINFLAGIDTLNYLFKQMYLKHKNFLDL